MSTPRLVAVTALAPAVWGTTYAVTTEFLPPGRPLFTALVRALPAGLLLVAVTRTLPGGGWWWRAAVLGTLNIGMFFPLLFLSAYRLPGGVAAVLGALQPLIVAALTRAALRENVPVHRVLAGIAATAGVCLVVLRADAALDAVGVAAGLLGAAGMAAGLVLTRMWGKPDGVSDLALTGWQLTAGGLLIAPLTFVVEGMPSTLDGAAVGGYLWLGLVGTAVAYTLWFRGVARLPALRVSLLGALSPLTAALLGWLALGQALSPLQLTGFALALTATVLGQLPAPPVLRPRTRPVRPDDRRPEISRRT
ncbi:putative blue pigment (indigoidine) exporter [Streptosporangium becharense]|uniref:Putative blue pigment (Indigoidine) exporter n=1 Tax=Streptosporangium becharense TaxID=1816182 RepID=A0A7W9IDH1_9ACTN|nr:EamA family transporter [Streptosporangium becharense]MBB2912172.1 putative blue pigment (indigoidine) exporter [Streptosporangium becharense]MBB5818719.1 putative blue pigment (indigoidine) exporter [Streptosporangium becharense]